LNLKSEELSTLNKLLRDRKIDLPDFRRTIGNTGSNYAWVSQNILKRNPNISDELKLLLGIKVK
jgi:hypothetical protein